MARELYEIIDTISYSLEHHFDAMANDLIEEGYVIDTSSKDYELARMVFLHTATEALLWYAVKNPKGDEETEEGYLNDLLEEYWDTEMDDNIMDILNNYLKE